VDDIKQDWSFIDKWFDDYGHTLEPRELARWAYSNGTWNKNMTKKPKLKVIDVIENGDTLDVYVDTNSEGRRLLMESAINQSFANLCNDNIHKLSWWKRFKYAWKNAK